MAEKWAKSSWEELNTEVQSRLAVEKATGALRLEKERLGKEIKKALKARDSAEAGLKTITKQAEDIRQQLHLSEINLATEKQMVSDLKAQLLQVKEAARLAREAAEAAVATSYERGVADTEARLTEEVAAVCRDYITMSWGVALDRAAVPADSDLRKKIFARFRVWFLLRSLLLPHPPFPAPSFLKKKGGMKRYSYQLRTNHLRTPLL